MYNPPHFKEDRPEILHAAIRAAGLAMLITHGAEGIEVSHIPLLLDADASPAGVLIGHLARANKQWRHAASGAEGLAVFTGPDAYVSPSWYASKAEHGKVVPTWNYVAIHVHGTLRAIEDAAELHALVSTLTNRHEGQRAMPWAVDDAPTEFVRSQLKGIVGVVLLISRIEGKWKMSQNRNEADRAGVIRALNESENPVARDVAGLIPP
jgi:transcriptional regulator